ncbi:protein GVQW3-like [Phyllopteryx taeniolatus]|uniref:protein GVQW3-like n=1 Tax=Phyllopteryx taeniolatus TaxID=161469 RepID=UPI002AD38BE4|nr:protein GVQW3-like [Phyllopteryx taeniolatus]
MASVQFLGWFRRCYCVTHCCRNTGGSTNTEQRIHLKFLVKLGKGPTECVKLLREAYGEDSMSRPRVFEWHMRFKGGREQVEDNPKSVRPSTTRTAENIDRVRQLMRSDCALTVRTIAEELGINRESLRTMLAHELRMRTVCAKCSSDEQKARRVSVCRDLLEKIQDEPEFLGRIVTGYETWLFQYDPETKRPRVTQT